MSDYELEQIIRKRHQFRKLLLARERVKQLERELRGEPVKPEDAPYVPEFLRLQVGTEWADRASSDKLCLHNEKEAHAMTARDRYLDLPAEPTSDRGPRL